MEKKDFIRKDEKDSTPESLSKEEITLHPGARFSAKNYIRAGSVLFALGVWYGYSVSLSWEYMFLLLGAGIILLGIWRRKRLIILFLAGALFFTLGQLRMQSALHHADTSSIDFYNGNGVTLTGIITEPPDARPDKTYLTIQVTTLETVRSSEGVPAESELPDHPTVGGKVLVTTTPQAKNNYGESIRISGKLETPKEGADFSYKNYLAKDDIFSTMNKPKIELLRQDQGNPVYAVLYSIRKKLEEQINLLFPEPYSSLMAGLLLGIKKTIPPDFLQDLQQTGLTHIIALSGFNITIIISFIAGFLLKGAGKKTRFGTAIGFVVLFTLMVGAAASILRAAIMGIIAIVAVSQGRQSDGLNLLLLALVIMITLHPISMLLDIGFQLSFLATLGLILLTEPVGHMLRHAPSRLGIRETLTTTIAAQIMVLPVILLNFEQVSIISPVSNLLILWILPLSMLFGTLAVVASLLPFVFLIAKLVSFMGWITLLYITNTVHILSLLPFAAVEVQWWSQSLSLLFYVVLAFLLSYRHVRSQKSSSNDARQTGQPVQTQ